MTAPDALLVITTNCPHCAGVLQGLSELVKSGTISRLEVINISQQPELAQEYNIRSVPWTRIGPFELDGLRSVAELRNWAEQAGSDAGMTNYLSELLRTGGLAKAIKLLSQNADYFSSVLTLATDPKTELSVRIGISAIMEEFEGTKELTALIKPLTKLTHHPEARIRLDACHYLALTHSPLALPPIKLLLEDENLGVREVAQESLDSLQS